MSRKKSDGPLGEAALFDRLRDRYPAREYALFSHVGDSTGYAKVRTADALAMGTWPSRGLKLFGFEMKSYRGDWLRELKKPVKAESICRFCDYWYLVTGAPDVARVEELPPTWGLLVAEGERLVEKRRAEQRVDVEPMTRAFMAAILRAANKAPSPNEDDLLHVKEKERRRLQTAHDAELQRVRTRHDDELAEWRRTFAELNEGYGLGDVGLSLNMWQGKAREIGKAIRFLVRGGFDGMDWQLQAALQHMQTITSSLESVIRERAQMKETDEATREATG